MAKINKNIYILDGENYEEKDTYIKVILNNCVPKEELIDSVAYYDALSEDSITNSIIDNLSTISMFSTVSMCVIRRAEKLGADSLRKLAPILGSLPSTSFVVFAGSTVGKGLGATHPFKKFLKLHKSKLESKNFKPLRDYELQKYIIEKASTDFNRTLPKDGADYLIKCIGNNLGALASELNKLDTIMPQKIPFSLVHLKKVTSGAGEISLFEIPDLLGKKDIPGLLYSLQTLYEYSLRNISALIPLVSDHFLRLLKLRMYFQKNPNDLKYIQAKSGDFRLRNAVNEKWLEVVNSTLIFGKPLGVGQIYPRIVIPGLLQQISNYSLKDLEYIVNYNAVMDFNSKSGILLDDKINSERYCLGIIYSNKYRTETLFV